MALETRLGTARDIDALAPLWTLMVEHHRGLVGQPWPVRAAEPAWAWCRQLYQQWLADDTGILFVAQLAGSDRIVGYAVCQLLPSGPTFDLGEVRGEVDSLVVTEESRGSGAGTALLNACREELRRRGITYWSIGVVEANRGAVALYERLGFRPWSRTMLAPIEERD